MESNLDPKSYMQVSLLKLFLITAMFAVAFGAFMPLGVLGMVLALVPGLSGSVLILLARKEQLWGLVPATVGTLFGVAAYLIWWWGFLNDYQRQRLDSRFALVVCGVILGCWLAGAIAGRAYRIVAARRALRIPSAHVTQEEPVVKSSTGSTTPAA